MNRLAVWLVTPLLLACVHLAEAQQPIRVYRIGVLRPDTPAGFAPRKELFRQTLRTRGDRTS